MTRTIPSVPLHIPSDVISPTDYNTYAAPSHAFLSTPPIFFGYQTATQLLANNATVPLNLDSELVDSDGGHNPTVNPSRYTAQIPGWYAACGVVSFAANTHGIRLAYVQRNGNFPTGSFGEYLACASGITSVPVNVQLVQLNVNDYIELVAFQNSGSSINTSVTTQSSSSMSVWWVAHI